MERPEIRTYTVLPENKIITTGSALEMQIPRLHSTPGIPGARDRSRRNPASSQSSPTRRVFGSRGCLGALRVAQGLQASPGTPLTLHPTTVLTPLQPQTLAPLQSKSRHPHWSPGPPALLRPQPDTPAPAPASLTPSAVSTASSKPQEFSSTVPSAERPPPGSTPAPPSSMLSQRSPRTRCTRHRFISGVTAPVPSGLELQEDRNRSQCLRSSTSLQGPAEARTFRPQHPRRRLGSQNAHLRRAQPQPGAKEAGHAEGCLRRDLRASFQGVRETNRHRIALGGLGGRSGCRRATPGATQSTREGLIHKGVCVCNLERQR